MIKIDRLIYNFYELCNILGFASGFAETALCTRIASGKTLVGSDRK